MTAPGTIGACVEDGARRLAAAGIEDARREARLILAHAIEADVARVIGYPEQPVPDPARYDALIARRAAREPLSHLTGRREFWSLDFEVGPAVLDPRADSETLVEAVLDAVPDHEASLRLLDFGTGSGCLLLALLHALPNATGLGVDRAPEAVAVARRNAVRLGLAGRARFAVGDWGAAITGNFHVIVSNPPYIPTGEIPELQPEVARYDPAGALDGGADGLDSYRVLAGDIVRLLRAGGVAALEFGLGQGAAVAAIFEGKGLIYQGIRADLAGIDRCILMRKG